MSGWIVEKQVASLYTCIAGRGDSISNDQPLCEVHKAKSSNVYEQPALVLMRRVEDRL